MSMLLDDTVSLLEALALLIDRATCCNHTMIHLQPQSGFHTILSVLYIVYLTTENPTFLGFCTMSFFHFTFSNGRFFRVQVRFRVSTPQRVPGFMGSALQGFRVSTSPFCGSQRPTQHCRSVPCCAGSLSS